MYKRQDEDSENIRIRVWEKLSSELTDLTVFDKSEPKPGIPGGITFTKENGSWMIRFWPGLFAEYYEYEACLLYTSSAWKRNAVRRSSRYAYA